MYTSAGPYSGNAPVYPIRVIKLIFYSNKNLLTSSTITFSICSFIIYFILCVHSVQIFHTNFADFLTFNPVVLIKPNCSFVLRLQELKKQYANSPTPLGIHQ